LQVHAQRQLTDEPLEFFVFALELVVLQHRDDGFATVLPQPAINRLGADGVLLGQLNDPLASLNLAEDFFLDLAGYASAHLIVPFLKLIIPDFCLILRGTDHGDNWDLVFHQNDYIFEVYSTANERMLWQVGYFPDIPLVESVVAEEDLLVLMHGLDNGAKGELIAIDWNGEVQTVIDLTTILGEDAKIHLISSVNKARQVVLWVVSDPLSHQDPNNTLVLLNLDTLELVDFCLPLERIGNVRWVGTGETLLIQEPPSTMTLLAIDTGDYRHLDTYFDPVGWIDDNDN
jgi:hypothetical protein